MELIVTITVLCTSLSLLLAPCASLRSDQLQASHKLAHNHQLTLPTLPRKLKLNEMATMIKKDGSEKGLNKHVQVVSGIISHQKDAQVMRARTGTRQEWIQKGDEDADALQFFTMDYSHVRRRRPIHNKSLPVAP